MVLRAGAWKQAVYAQIRTGKRCTRWKSSVPEPAAAAAKAANVANADKASGEKDKDKKQVDLTSLYTSISRNERHKKSQERDFLVSVLSSSPTKRDAKKYLQTFGSDKPKNVPKTEKTEQPSQTAPPTITPSDGAYYAADSIRAVSQSPQFVQGPGSEKVKLRMDDQPHVAIVKLQDPDTIDDATLEGLAKTFVQLRALGLVSVVVIGRTKAHVGTQADTQANTKGPGWFDYVTHATLRVAAAIDKYGDPVTSIVDSAVSLDDQHGSDPVQYKQHARLSGSTFTPGQVYIDREENLLRPLRKGDIVIIPPYAFSTTKSEAKLVDTDNTVLALTRYFAGMQRLPSTTKTTTATTAEAGQTTKAIASVDRVIVIDPIGGTPSALRPNGAHVFLNMEEEYRSAKAAVDEMASKSLLLSPSGQSLQRVCEGHKANLDIVRNTLALLPSSSSALLTTPAEAANLVSHERSGADDADDVFGYVGSVGTRRSQNPLIHNLLTDRPVYSSSLPIGRIKPKSKSKSKWTSGLSTSSKSSSTSSTSTSLLSGVTVSAAPADEPPMSQTTLLKRGMPLTIYPDPRKTPWTPPMPGGPRLRLTDTCIDLPRLVHLIEDSFNRKLDVQDYLKRVENSLAGVIIAGEYEGGAILTWERPFGLDEETAYRTGRLVPYLDKFAVLKKSQGAGGVADIVFTAMVRDCFPEGVCWRSRKDNPVNRWYFERSRGSWKLGGVNWTMFWTTPWGPAANHGVDSKSIWDYESVCRGVEPSWADQKHILD
ncbi:Amino-acid acetyltransferase, mitochondrial [Sporothrix bragantina]|uniref:Amino-acid acetyltransferase, mitochondrial n=1 Tax=Sporothrix bragantina TaxID=671064 RepID=A0ABP0AXN4_9PEZI